MSDELKNQDSENIPPKEPTFGQIAVGPNYNPANLLSVERCREYYARCIDQMQSLREQATSSAEQKHLASIAITEAQRAHMWAVKALTWKD